jgi:electron transfer flavoprotein alpha/beta subunit
MVTNTIWNRVRIRIDPATRTLVPVDVPLVLNPLDKNALEAALQLKERPGAQVSVLSMGPPAAANMVKECLALGADQGILLSDRAFAGADAFATAYTLAKGVERLAPFDLILCGRASSDGSTEWVGPELASLLGLPVITMVNEIVESDGEWWPVRASLENGYRLARVRLPAVLTGSPTLVSAMMALESRRAVEMIGRTRQEKAGQLVQKLANAGVI